MTDREKQDNILKHLCEVCDELYALWNDATEIDDYEFRRLVMREAASTFYNTALLIQQVDMGLNMEGGVFHA